MNDAAKTMFTIAVIIFIIAGIILGIRNHRNHADRCERNGGHVTSHTVRLNGDSDTTYYCLAPNGGTLDVW